MARLVLGIIAVVASFMLADSLICNKCSYGLVGFCLSNSEINCTTNTSRCFTGKVSFTSLSSIGFNTQGCIESTGCTDTTNSTLIGLSYQSTITCCSTDKCNPTTVSGAPSNKMTFTAAIGVAVLASMLGSIL
ncbi:sperm acrosome membrane-associated protein 4-like [Cottoperca gobio]|uniref:Sperm acrosome membrane-associated protein 4-like n=1 Tax=Cottoperca gobio TaxID=56716 RepID=A0A6J2QJV7_COTGO|nr:sperm acrosome membrane-associated protein 4-like [Cottoperca gobio]